MARIILEKHLVQELRTICREFVDDATVAQLVETLYPITRVGSAAEHMSVVMGAAKQHADNDIQVLQFAVLLAELICEKTRGRLFIAHAMAPVSWDGHER